MQCANFEKNSSDIALSKNVHFNATPITLGALNITGVSGSNNISFCRVLGTIMYGAEENNTLNFEVWLPEPVDYNGRYISVGKFL